MKVSEILWEAANTHLWDGTTGASEAAGLDYRVPDPAQPYSCDAISSACLRNFRLRMEQWSAFYAARDFLASLGLDGGFECFAEFEFGEERQGARYLWLDFARLVAEDEGR